MFFIIKELQFHIVDVRNKDHKGVNKVEIKTREIGDFAFSALKNNQSLITIQKIKIERTKCEDQCSHELEEEFTVVC